MTHNMGLIRPVPDEVSAEVADLRWKLEHDKITTDEYNKRMAVLLSPAAVTEGQMK